MLGKEWWVSVSKNCQVFTSPEQAIELLDASGYTDKLFGKKVLENSCGDGAVLIEICKRYIEDCFAEGYSVQNIKDGLENDIIGFEVDKFVYLVCLSNLTALSESYGINDVKWNIHCKDALKESICGFDYIIGNPPYISYNDMNTEDRVFIQNTFSACKNGKVDYYYAFIQSGIEKLNPNGVLAYILPSSIYKNISGKNIRELLLPYVTDVYDYSTSKQFGSVTTSSTILVCKKFNDIEQITYHDVVRRKAFDIEKRKLQDKWYFTNKNEEKNGKRFGDYFKVSNSIATLYNEAFLLDGAIYENGFYHIDGEVLEERLIVKAVSMKNTRDKKNQYIIFPYCYDENEKLCRISEEELRESFPGVYSHLLRYKDRLLERTSEKNAKWYEYGRSQGLAHINKRKLITSVVITNSIQTVMAEAYDVPYAGIYIQQIGDMPLKSADRILKSKEFWDYISIHSINSVGKSNRISVKEVSNYYFE